MTAIVALLALAQDVPPKPEDLASISGKVINKLTREPIKFADVVLSAGEFTPETVKSGPDGSFSVDSLRPGRYTAQTMKTGYTTARRKPGQPPEFLILEKGMKKTGVVLEMLPQAAVSGRVQDENGEPVAGASVSAEMVRRLPNGMTRPVATNDRGEYRLYNLEPGRYRIKVSPQQGFQFGNRPDAKPARVRADGGDAAPKDGPVPVYFPSATVLEQGAVIELAAGDERQGIDVQMVKARVFEVNGRVVPPSGWASNAPPQAGMGTIVLIALRRGGTFASAGSGSGIDNNGRFSVKNVAPGSYLLMANLMNSQTHARLRVEVGGTDLQNVEVRFGSPVTLAGTVKAPDGLDPRRLRILLTSADAMGMPAQSAVDAKGAFKLENVSADTMTLRVMGLEPDGFIQGVRLDGQDAEPDALNVRSDSASLEVTVAKNGGVIEGIVRPAAGEGEHETAVVVLWPAGSGDAPPRPSLVRMARAGAKGRYRFQGIRPGKYLLAAFDSMTMGPQGSPEEEALLWAKTKAESVTIDPDARLTRELKSLGDPE